MIKGDCPVCGRMIDIMTHAADAVNLVSHHGKWQSRIFQNQFELMEWMSTFDLKESAAKAKVQKAQHGVRLVGDGWLTMTMSLLEFDQWCASLGIKNPIKADAAAAAKANLAAKKAAPKEVTAEVKPESKAKVEAGVADVTKKVKSKEA